MRVTRGLAYVCIIGITASSVGSASRSADSSEIANRFIGTWRLVSIEGATNLNLGAHPAGLIYYDATGHMAAQIVPDRPRPTWTGSPTPEQAKEAITGYVAYFGTYTVDEQTQTVKHHREGTLVPGPVDFVRKYEFVAGDRLILMPVETTSRLTWQRIKSRGVMRRPAESPPAPLCRRDAVRIVPHARSGWRPRSNFVDGLLQGESHLFSFLSRAGRRRAVSQ
jgi:Lipocalin-like domain